MLNKNLIGFSDKEEYLPKDFDGFKIVQFSDLHSGGQLGADDCGHHSGADFPIIVKPCCRLWYCRHRRGYDRHAVDGRIVCGRVEMEVVVRMAGGDRLLDHRRRVFPRKPHKGA